MKTFTFLFAALLPGLTGCDKNKEMEGVGDPFRYEVYFDFTSPGNKGIVTGEIMITPELFRDENGVLVLHKSHEEPGWDLMKTRETESDTLFGPVTLTATVEEKVEYTGQALEQEHYRLVRFNNVDVDTLRIVTFDRVDEKNHLWINRIALYYNGVLISSLNWLPNDPDSNSSLIYYFNGENIASTRKNTININPWILTISKEPMKVNKE